MDLTMTPGRDSADRRCLSLEGSLDLESRDRFLDSARALLREGEAGPLVIELSAVTFVDSSGLGALVTLIHEGEDVGAAIVIHAPTERVRRLIQVTGLDHRWVIES